MDTEQREAIKTKFIALGTEAESPEALDQLLDQIIEETEADRIKREQVAQEKSDILKMETLPAPIYNTPRPGNPLGLNRRAPPPKCLHRPPFESHDEHDKWMMRLVGYLRELEEMGTNDTTNQKNWFLEGEAVGAFARKMRNALFPEQSTIPAAIAKPEPELNPFLVPAPSVPPEPTNG